MPSCPNCGTAIATPAKVFTVIVEPKEGERGLTQRKVGMYNCDKCGTKFPTVVSRQHYLVVPDDQMNKIQTDIKNLKKTNQDLEKHIQLMDKEYAELQKSLEQEQEGFGHQGPRGKTGCSGEARRLSKKREGRARREGDEVSLVASDN